jgi:hypothetical protein
MTAARGPKVPRSVCIGPECRGLGIPGLPWCDECWGRLPPNLREWFTAAGQSQHDRTARTTVLNDHLRALNEIARKPFKPEE